MTCSDRTRKLPRSILLVFFFISQTVFSQQFDQTAYQSLQWRMIGPFRGGRGVAGTGVPGQPNVFYIGVNNGGVWKTNDFGRTWNPIFDDQPTGSIGALAVAPSDPNIIYVGTGEGLQRPDLAVGDGMFKSEDGGKTWKHIGLDDAQQIAMIIVDPRDANHVFVAVPGHPYGPNVQRGVVESKDGGRSWGKSLYIDENTCAMDVAFDPANPEILYADMWAGRLGPWENAEWQGKTSGLFKSVSGGRTWRKLTKGLPTAEQGLGRIGFGIAASDPHRIYATVDAKENGGVYRSDDAGESWELIATDKRLWGRGSDFAEIKVHPKNKDIVFVGNIAAYRSTDAGRSWECFKGAPGGDDYHRIWINPDNPDIILLHADQGAVVSVNGGETWSSWYNQPTAQLYHVSTDTQWPYNVFGGQQESGSVGIASRGNDGQITFREWHPVGADEYSYVAPDPLNPNIVYGGRVTRFDKTTGQVQNVAPEAVRSGKYRILRTMPLLFSKADPSVLFFATNVLFKTTSGGQTWEIASPDLSREHPEVPASIGIFRTPDLRTMSRRGVIYAVGPSPKDVNIIWAGTDDGLIHVTWDGGTNWQNVTPKGLTAWSKVSQLDAGHFDVATAYAAVNCIRLDDMRPHIFRTHDGGKRWKEITRGIPANGPVNVVREDPERPGLLFAGTEREVYVSFNDGDDWQSLRRNMPATSIRDLVIHEDDLVVGTHGRSIWILDNITPLRQLSDSVRNADAFLFEPQIATRVRWNENTDTPLPPEEPGGQNPPDGAIVDYYLRSDASEVVLEFLDKQETVIRRFSNNDKPETFDPNDLPYPMYWIRPPMIVSAKKGMQRFVWDLHYPPPEGVRRSHPISAIHRNTAAGPSGPWVQPGLYTVRLIVDGATLTRELTVRLDPRVKVSDLQQQFDNSIICYEGYKKAFALRKTIHHLRTTLWSLSRSPSGSAIGGDIAELEKKLASIEGGGTPDNPDIAYSFVSVSSPGSASTSGLQSTFLFLMKLLQNADAEPTSQLRRAVQEEKKILDELTDRWKDIADKDLKTLNTLLKQRGIDPVGQ
jgi:photosystem II stability/assembly factor-like uncharacterized protein